MQEVLNKMINQLLTTYLEYKMMILLYVDFIVLFHRIYACRKFLLDYTNLFSPNNYKNNDKIIYTYFKAKYVKY